MHNLPFDKPGKFWRGNLHTHSTRSDGTQPPQEVCRYYRALGHHFVALTDHFMPRYNYPITDDASLHTDDFITLTGAELHAGAIITGDMWHILAVGLPADFAPNLDGEDGPAITRRALDTGAYVAVAHPAWYNLTEADVLSLGQDVHAIEIYNGISADANDRADSVYMLDVMLAQGYRYNACATDDAHFHLRYRDVGLGWVQVRSETLTRAGILDALKAGHYYSSTGPQIHDIQVYPGDKIIVRCSPATAVHVVGKGASAKQTFGTNLREAELSLRGFTSPYCRITVRDASGKRAWSNPIWFA